MTKVAKNYPSIIRGVSEQSPELRPEGQITEQVNMIPDPIEGLARRFGSLFQAERKVYTGSANMSVVQADVANWRTFDYFSQGKDYTICLRRAAKPSGSVLPVMLVYNRTDNVFLTLSRPVTDADLDAFEAGGASAVQNIGKYVFFAGNTLLPSSTSTDVWGDATNQAHSVVWIRGGAFARTFRVTATKTDNSTVSFEYTTPLSQYPQALDTSGVPVWIPDSPAPGSVPTLENASDDLGFTAFTAGQTTVLSHPPYSATSILSFYLNGNSGDFIVYAVQGLDYSVSGNTITWLRDIVGQVNFVATYQWAPGGTSTGLTYSSATDTEAAFIRRDGDFGVAELVWKDWQPANLLAYTGVLGMTNVYPALPAAPGEYSWADGSGKVVFHGSMVNALTVSITYDHTKVILNPNYSKQVNDVTNDYNTAVTKWIGDSAEAIEPQAIAEQLRLAAVAAGLSSATRQASTVVFDNVKALTVDDGGDGSLIRGVANEVASVDDVSVLHYVGKTVRVRGKSSKESFYLKATAKDPAVTSGVTEVIWIEGVGMEFSINARLIYGTAIGTTFYMASTAAALNTLTGLTGDDAAVGYSKNLAGDADTNPLPYFIGRKITLLTAFQDRLLVGCGGVIRASATSDYLNFFRTTVLALPADDAMEFLSQSAADDELRYSVFYDQTLVMFGLKRQYFISGSTPLTPTNANMTILASHANAAELPPIEAGGLIFYGKKGPSSSSVHQIQPALSGSRSPDSFNISSQIDLYLKGDAIEFAQIAKPASLFLRTAGSPNSLYVFNYLDTQEGRKQDAWHRWDYASSLGPIAGMQATTAGVLVFTLRTALNASGNPFLYAVADLQVLTTQQSPRPYLDSLRAASNVGAEQSVNANTTGLYVAFDTSSEYKYLGSRWEDYADLLAEFPAATGPWVGAKFDAYFEPTNPFIRDSNGKAVTTGRLTVTTFKPSFVNSSGYDYDITFARQTTTFSFNGRVIGDPNNLVGRVPVSSYNRTLVVGRETREFRVRIKAQTWTPFTVNTLAWVGQYFNHTRQV